MKRSKGSLSLTERLATPACMRVHETFMNLIPSPSLKCDKKKFSYSQTSRNLEVLC